MLSAVATITTTEPAGRVWTGGYNMEWYCFLFSACVADLLTRQLNIKRAHYQWSLGQSPSARRNKKTPAEIPKPPSSQPFPFLSPNLPYNCYCQSQLIEVDFHLLPLVGRHQRMSRSDTKDPDQPPLPQEEEPAA